jgi:hypothetical protein
VEGQNSHEHDRSALTAAVVSRDPEWIGRALLAVVNGDPEWAWLEEQCLGLLVHPDVQVRGLAATSLGHVARLHGHLHASAVDRLREAQTDATIAGRVHDALSDIDIFLIGRPVV